MPQDEGRTERLPVAPSLFVFALFYGSYEDSKDSEDQWEAFVYAPWLSTLLARRRAKLFGFSGKTDPEYLHSTAEKKEADFGTTQGTQKLCLEDHNKRAMRFRQN